MRFGERDVAVRQMAGERHRPQPVEVHMRPRENELQLGSPPDNRAAGGGTRGSHDGLVLRIQANDDVFHVAHRFASRSLQFEPRLAFDVWLNALMMHCVQVH